MWQEPGPEHARLNRRGPSTDTNHRKMWTKRRKFYPNVLKMWIFLSKWANYSSIWQKYSHSDKISVLFSWFCQCGFYLKYEREYVGKKMFLLPSLFLMIYVFQKSICIIVENFFCNSQGQHLNIPWKIDKNNSEWGN